MAYLPILISTGIVYLMAICIALLICYCRINGNPKVKPWHNRVIIRQRYELSKYLPQVNVEYDYGIDLTQWLDWHLDKYPNAKLPKQEVAIAVSLNGDGSNQKLTFFDGIDERSIKLFKDFKVALNKPEPFRIQYQYYDGLRVKVKRPMKRKICTVAVNMEAN